MLLPAAQDYSQFLLLNQQQPVLCLEIIH